MEILIRHPQPRRAWGRLAAVLAALLLSIAFTRSFASFELQHFASRRTIAGNTVAPETVANITLSGPIGRGLDLVDGVRNLFNERYADPGSDEHIQDSIEQNGRTLRVGIRWTPGAR